MSADGLDVHLATEVDVAAGRQRPLVLGEKLEGVAERTMRCQCARSLARSEPKSETPSTARARTSGVTSSAGSRPSVLDEAVTEALTAAEDKE